MSRKVVRMTLDHLAELEAPCRSCVFWELDPVRRERVDEPAAEKEAWMSAVLRDWGSCGRVVLVDDRPVGYALYAPPAYFPGSGAFPTSPVSADAVLLSAVYVEPAARGGGLGRMLVQGMARDLIERGGIACRRGVRRHPRPGRGRGAPVPDAGRLPDQRGLQDAARARDHPTDEDGPAERAVVARRGGGRAGAAARGGPAARRRHAPTTRERRAASKRADGPLASSRLQDRRDVRPARTRCRLALRR